MKGIEGLTLLNYTSARPHPLLMSVTMAIDPAANNPQNPVTLLTVLVVDDDGSIRTIVGQYLEHCGFAVKLAASGAEALEIYRADPSAIVLVDIRMPGLDGLATLAALKEINPDCACCMMSGGLDDSTGEELQTAGATVVIKKPFSPAQLRQLILSMDKERRRA